MPLFPGLRFSGPGVSELGVSAPGGRSRVARGPGPERGHRSCGHNVRGKYWADQSASSFRLQLLSTLRADLGLGPCQVGYQAAEAAAKLALLHLAVCCARLGAGILEQFPPRDAEIEICWCKWLKVWDNVSLNNQEMGSKRVVKWRGRGLRCWRRILRLRCPSLRSIPGPGQIVAPLHADIVTPSSLFNKADLWKFIFKIF